MIDPKRNEVVEEYKGVQLDFAYDPSIFSEEDERVRKVKYIVFNRLTAAERTLILMYFSELSLRKVAKKFGVSHVTIGTEVNRIKRKILDIYDKLGDI